MAKSRFTKIINVLGMLVLTFFMACEKETLVNTGECSGGGYEKHPESGPYQGIIEKYSKAGLPGIVLLIRDDKGVWVGAAGKADIKKGISMETCHGLKVASITKPFIATLVMMLKEDNVIDLNDQAGEWLNGETLENIENGKKATIRQLLNHSSGIYDVISDDDFYLSILNHPQKEWEARELLEFVRGDPAYFPPGTDVHYSNTNYLLLSMILEEAAGIPHGQLLKKRILEPLGLDQTVYHPHDPLPGHMAQGYYDLYNNDNIRNLTNYNTGNGNGYNGIYSTVKDLQVFIEALLRKQSLLKPESVDQMLNFDLKAENGKKNGLGLFRDFLYHPSGTYAFGHRGRDLAYSGDMYWFPEEDITMVTLVNYGTDGEGKLKEAYLDYRDEVVSELMD